MKVDNRSVATVDSAIAALLRHYTAVVLPIWRSAGFNAELELPYEAVDPVAYQPSPVSRYRAMACARQLFVFSRAGELDHAARLFESLVRNFRDVTRGGWYYSVDPDLAPLDTTKDLYTHAFVVFACSEYLVRSGEPQAERVLRDTAELIETRFPARAKGGLMSGALDRDFEQVVTLPIQNPIMHLAEAYLAANAATGDGSFDEALQRIARMMVSTFLDSRTGCILELPCGTEANRIEPGHQFEWFYLVRSGSLDWAGERLSENMNRAFEFAQHHGIDYATKGVRAALNLDASVQDATQRIWAQTEYLRALALQEGSARSPKLVEQILAFSSNFLLQRGWIECLADDGRTVRSDMPSTTPYHLCTAYAELQNLISSPQ